MLGIDSAARGGGSAGIQGTSVKDGNGSNVMLIPPLHLGRSVMIQRTISNTSSLPSSLVNKELALAMRMVEDELMKQE